MAEFVVLLLRESSLVGAGRSLSSGVASLKRSWCKGTKKKVEGDWIRFIRDEMAPSAGKQAENRKITGWNGPLHLLNIIHWEGEFSPLRS